MLGYHRVHPKRRVGAEPHAVLRGGTCFGTVVGFVFKLIAVARQQWRRVQACGHQPRQVGQQGQVGRVAVDADAHAWVLNLKTAVDGFPPLGTPHESALFCPRQPSPGG